MRAILAIFCLVLACPLGARDLGSRPLILLHGYGPENLIQLSTFRDHLVADGIDEKSILLVSYDSKATIEEITSLISSQLQSFLAAYPAGQRIDVVGHSLGGFIGLYVPLQSISNQIDHYTALAGWTHGQNSLPSACKFLDCGQTLPLLVPTDNQFLLRFFWESFDQIHAMKKCSLWSPDDTLTTDPRNSGGFADGVNVKIEGVKHLQFKDDEDVYAIFRTTCYGEPPPPNGFKHKWTYQGARLDK